MGPSTWLASRNLFAFSGVPDAELTVQCRRNNRPSLALARRTQPVALSMSGGWISKSAALPPQALAISSAVRSFPQSTFSGGAGSPGGDCGLSGFASGVSLAISPGLILRDQFECLHGIGTSQKLNELGGVIYRHV